jgi:dienelactone hydrolase
VRNLPPLLACLFIAAPVWGAAPDVVRGQIRDALDVPADLPPLKTQVYGQFTPEAGIVAERVSYTTAYGLRVPAIVYRPASPHGRVPGIVVVNGHGGDKYSWYAFYAGILYARAGAVVLTYDPIGEGERNIQRKSETRAHDELQSPPEIATRLAGLMVTDAMQGISYLLSRPEVNRNRIAIVGYSLGSYVAAITRAVDPRIYACVLAGGGNLDATGEYWETSKPMCTGLSYQALSFLGDRGAVIYSLHAASGPTLVYNGLDDEIVLHDPRGPEEFFRDLQQRTAALHGTKTQVFETGFEAGAGHRPWFVTKPAALWLERQLDFPAWTVEEIAAMPVTHISEWAAANHVEVDKDYANEKREGGERALGAGMPPLSRAQLSVYTDAEWKSAEPQLTYEAWLAAAQRQLTGKGLASYDIARVTSPIVIDGKLDESAWAATRSTTPFHLVPGDRSKGDIEQTEVKMLWDDQNLYVAFRCDDRHISAQVLQRHGPVSKDDCVEIFISPNPRKVKNYYTFEINAIGTMLNRCRTAWWTGGPTWEPEGVQCTTSLANGVVKAEAATDREWIVELAIPLRNFSHDAAHTPPQPGDIWRLNLDRTGGVTNALGSTWSPLPPAVRTFHTPTAFGMVRFVDATNSAK